MTTSDDIYKSTSGLLKPGETQPGNAYADVIIQTQSRRRGQFLKEEEFSIGFDAKSERIKVNRPPIDFRDGRQGIKYR